MAMFACFTRSRSTAPRKPPSVLGAALGWESSLAANHAPKVETWVADEFSFGLATQLREFVVPRGR
jgi:hypothetical protein